MIIPGVANGASVQNCTRSELVLNRYRAYISPFLFFVGVPMNVFMILVFNSMHRKQPCRFHIYAIILSVGYIAILTLESFAHDFLGDGLMYLTNDKHGINLNSISLFTCRAYNFLSAAAPQMVASIMILFSLDRVYYLFHPSKTKIDDYIPHTHVTIILVCTVCLISHTPHLFNSNLLVLDNGSRSCGYYNPHSGAVVYTGHVLLMGATLLPSLLNVIIDLVGAVKLSKLLLSERPPGWTLEFSMTISVLINNFLAMCFSVPYSMLIVMRYDLKVFDAEDEYPNYSKLINETTELFQSLESINYILDFIIYFVFMPSFRSSLWQHLQSVFKNGCTLHRRKQKKPRCRLKCIEDCQSSPTRIGRQGPTQFCALPGNIEQAPTAKAFLPQVRRYSL